MKKNRLGMMVFSMLSVVAFATSCGGGTSSFVPPTPEDAVGDWTTVQKTYLDETDIGTNLDITDGKISGMTYQADLSLFIGETSYSVVYGTADAPITIPSDIRTSLDNMSLEFDIPTNFSDCAGELWTNLVSMYGEGVELPSGVNIPKSRSLEGISRYKRLIIMASGIVMNFVLAYIIFFICASCFPQYNIPFINVVRLTNEDQYAQNQVLTDDFGNVFSFQDDKQYVLGMNNFKTDDYLIIDTDDIFSDARFDKAKGINKELGVMFRKKYKKLPDLGNDFDLIYEDILNYCKGTNKTIVIDCAQFHCIKDIGKLKGTIIIIRTCIDTCYNRTISRWLKQHKEYKKEDLEKYKQRKKSIYNWYKYTNTFIEKVDKIKEYETLPNKETFNAINSAYEEDEKVFNSVDDLFNELNK